MNLMTKKQVEYAQNHPFGPPEELKPKSTEGKGIKREDKLEQDIIAGRKVFLYDDNDCNGVGVEGYEAGQEYEVDEVRIRPTWGVQIFLKGNIHSYPIKSFIKIN